jgi:hypothetical protein
VKLHITANGKARNLGTLRSVLDFFFPCGDVLRYEAVTFAPADGCVRRHFYTFRAFAVHYAHELFINPLVRGVNALSIPELQFRRAGAIAFDAKTHQTDGGGAVASKTVAHTVTGSNPYLIDFNEGTNAAADRITGVTYNAVSMSSQQSTKGDSGRFISTFVKANPSTGTNNLIISSSPSDIIGASIISLSGAQQTDTPDSKNTATSASTASLSVSTTVVAANSWLVAFSHGTCLTAGAGTNVRSETTADGYVSGDSNGTVSTGSQSLVFTNGAAGAVTALILSIAPASNAYTQTLTETPTISDTIKKATTRVLTQTLTLTEVFAAIRIKIGTFIEYLLAADDEYALHFGGPGALNNVKVLHSTSTNLGNGDNYTVFARFRSSQRVDQSVSEKWGDTGADKYPWAIRGPRPSTGKVSFNIYDGVNNPGVTSSAAYDDGLWHSVVGVRDFSTTLIRLYMDGTADGTVTDNSTGDVSTTRNLYVGSRNNGTANTFAGDIAEFMVFQGVVSPADILALHTSGTIPSNTLLLHLPFNNGSGSTVTDVSGNQNNGAITGATWLSGNGSGKPNARGIFRSLIRTLTEAATILDTVPRKIQRALSELTTLTDLFSKTQIFVRSFVESLTIADRFAAAINGLQTFFSSKFPRKSGTYSQKYPSNPGSYASKYPKKEGDYSKKFPQP